MMDGHRLFNLLEESPVELEDGIANDAGSAPTVACACPCFITSVGRASETGAVVP